MSGNQLVSIVSPAYNAERFIADSIESVQAQSHKTWEMLVVDDGSQDATREIVLEYASNDRRIRSIFLSENGGPAAARQAALTVAKGRYIAFIDADDLWLPRKLERQLDFMREREAVVSFTAFRRASANLNRVGRLIKVPESLDYSGLLRQTAIATSTVIVDRGKSGPLVMKQTYYDDFALWLSILRRGVLAYGLNEDLVRYRVVGNSISRNKIKSAKWVWRTYRSVEGLGRVRSCWCLANYACNAVLKYARF